MNPKVSERTILLCVMWCVAVIQTVVISDVFVFSDAAIIKVTHKTFEDGGGIYLDKDKYYLSASEQRYRTSSDIWQHVNIGLTVEVRRSSFADYIYKVDASGQDVWFRNIYLYLLSFILMLGLLMLSLFGSEIALYVGMLPAIYLLNAFRMLF